MYVRPKGIPSAKWQRMRNSQYGRLPPDQQHALEIKDEAPPSEKLKRQRRNAALLRSVTGTRGNLAASSRHLLFHSNLTALERDVLMGISRVDAELRRLEGEVRRLLKG